MSAKRQRLGCRSHKPALLGHDGGTAEQVGPRLLGVSEGDQHRQAGVVEHPGVPEALAAGSRELDRGAPEHFVHVT